VIVHVINGLERGGAETTLFRLVSASSAHDFQVVSLTSEGYFGPLLRERGIPVTCLNMRIRESSPFAIFPLVRLLKRLRPQLIQTWMPHANLLGGIAARVAGIPVCWGVRQANLSLAANKRRTLATARVCAWLSNWLPSIIVSCSRRAVAVHVAYGYAPRFEVIPNGIDVAEFFPKAGMRELVRLRLGISSDELVVGHVGRFDVHKDYDTLLTACGLLSQQHMRFRLLLCGPHIDGDNEALSALVAKHGMTDKVILLGARSDVEELMHAMDILAMSSLAEAFPNVVAEAMAVGLPCVVTDVGDAADIVGDTGWIVPPQDPPAFSRAMAEALNSSAEDRHLLGQAARSRVESRYSLDRMVASYERVWDGISGRKLICAD
jgi:glycosyltransferase involved in cell wall biosynthesis